MNQLFGTDEVDWELNLNEPPGSPVPAQGLNFDQAPVNNESDTNLGKTLLHNIKAIS